MIQRNKKNSIQQSLPTRNQLINSSHLKEIHNFAILMNIKQTLHICHSDIISSLSFYAAVVQHQNKSSLKQTQLQHLPYYK